MYVIEFAENKIECFMKLLDYAVARGYKKDEAELRQGLDYWKGYRDGARAQKNEDEKEKENA